MSGALIFKVLCQVQIPTPFSSAEHIFRRVRLRLLFAVLLKPQVMPDLVSFAPRGEHHMDKKTAIRDKSNKKQFQDSLALASAGSCLHFLHAVRAGPCCCLTIGGFLRVFYGPDFEVFSNRNATELNCQK